jgi:AcrR family transcriptional regulator
MAATDSEILKAAQQLFYERGYGAVGVDLIGEEAGVTGPAIYSHFSGKGEILATLFDEAMDRMLVLAGPVRDDPAADLDHLITAQARFVLENRELLTVYTREDRALEAEALRRFRRRQRDYVERWVDALTSLNPDRPRDELISVAHAVIGVLMSVTAWPREALRTEGLEELLADLARGCLGGLSRTSVKAAA